MERNDIKLMLPTNDNMIFVDKNGMLAERIGIAYSESGGIFYVDNMGFICDIEDNPADAIIAKKGDTIKFSDLGLAYMKYNEYDSIIDQAYKFFTVRKDNLDEMITISFDTEVMGKNSARLDVKNDCFPGIGYLFIDFTKPDYHNEEDRVNAIEKLMVVLQDYAILLGKKPKLSILFEKSTRPWYSELELQLRNEKIYELEKKYLPGLRKYINDKFDSLYEYMEKSRIEIENDHYAMNENKIRFASKFDVDTSYMGE